MKIAFKNVLILIYFIVGSVTTTCYAAFPISNRSRDFVFQKEQKISKIRWSNALIYLNSKEQDLEFKGPLATWSLVALLCLLVGGIGFFVVIFIPGLLFSIYAYTYLTLFVFGLGWFIGLFTGLQATNRAINKNKINENKIESNKI